MASLTAQRQHMLTAGVSQVGRQRTCGRVCLSSQRSVVTGVAAPSAPSTSSGVKEAKEALLDSIKYTGRGKGVKTFQRGQIEELQTNLEAFQAAELDYKLLEGKWKLLYTTANDVLPILEAEHYFTNPFGPSPLQIGNIYQQFSSPEVGIITNIIHFGVPFFLEDKESVTFSVDASYEVRSGKRVALTFEAARVDTIRISPALEALLAPAVLPRGFLTHQLLLAIKQFQLRIPFRSAQQVANFALAGRTIAANYMLTYLDEDTLIGRATALGGTFIFSRELAHSA